MKVVVTADGSGLEAPFAPVFGRCPVFVLVDTDTWACEAIPNGAMRATGGAGIQAAQAVVDQGADAVITGSVGPKAYQVLASAGVPVYVFDGNTVRDAIEAYRVGWLSSVTAPTGPAHPGKGIGQEHRQ